MPMPVAPSRRTFLSSAAGAGMGLALGGRAMAAVGAGQGLRGRFVTHISLVRVNQVEVTPTHQIGEDESADNTPAHIRARREAFAAGCPGGKMTWGISWLALKDQRPQYKEARELLARYHHELGDEITYIPGGYFAPMYDTREHNRRNIHEALALVSEMVGGGYRPQCLVAGYMDAENQGYLAKDEGIHVCQGQIWSQHGVDHGDGDGGLCYPYYPSREHFLKPAQGPADFIDCVCLDGWSCDFLSARLEGVTADHNSRQGVGPIESVGDLGEGPGHNEMMATTAMYFDEGYALNGFGFVTSIWEVSVGHDADLTWWLKHVRERWPDTEVVTEGDFGMRWRAAYPTNAGLNYRFDAKGTGAPGSGKELEIRWYMNQRFRLALLRNWETPTPWMVIDLTRYDLPAREPAGLQRDWSLMNVMNQKGLRPQDKPVRLGALPEADRRLVLARYPELRSLL